MELGVVFVVVSVMLQHSTGVKAEMIQCPQNITVPLGTNGTFTCKSKSSIVWLHELMGDYHLYSNMTKQNFITFSQDDNDDLVSTFTLSGIPENNMSRVTCGESNDDAFSRLTYSAALFSVYGPPSPLMGLHMTSVLSRNEIKLTWNPSFSFSSIPFRYSVEIVEFNGKGVLFSTTDSTSFLYVIPQESCSAYRIKVQASNAAGGSKAAILEYDALAKPNLTTLYESLNISIYLLAHGEIVADINFTPVQNCVEHPVVNYFLVLLDEEEVQFRYGPSVHSHFSLNSTLIEENMKYSYTIEAVNNISLKSKTPEALFYTTDVQSSLVHEGRNSAVVECRFIPGSLSKGCWVQVTKKGSKFVLQNYAIPRNPGQNVAMGKLEAFVVSKDLEVNIFDWEFDGTVGNISILASISYTEGELLSSTAAISVERKGHFLLIVVSSVVGGCFVVSLAVIITTFGCYGLYYGRRKSSSERKQTSHQWVSRPSTYEDCHGNGETNIYGEIVDVSTGEPVYAIPQLKGQDNYPEDGDLGSPYDILRRNMCSSMSETPQVQESDFEEQDPTYNILRHGTSSRTSGGRSPVETNSQKNENLGSASSHNLCSGTSCESPYAHIGEMPTYMVLENSVIEHSLSQH